MVDVEGRSTTATSGGGGGGVDNPYSDDGGLPPSTVPPYVDKLRRVIYMALSAYALTYFNFFRVLLKSPHIRHGWFQVGLALTVGTCLCCVCVFCRQCRTAARLPSSRISPYHHHYSYCFSFVLVLTAILGIKAYVEVYQGKIRRREVRYDNFRQTTHAVMALIGAATLAFNVALWPHYGWNAPILLAVSFFGVVLQFLLIVPPSIQNAVALVGVTFFLQEYSGYSGLVY